MKTILLVMCLSLSSAFCAAQSRAAAKAKTDEANDEQLIKCVEKGDAGCVAGALAAGADANAINERGEPALVLAAEGQSASIARLLLDAGADVNKEWQGAGTPLCRAALFGREKIAEMLLAEGAKINIVCDTDHGDTPLMEALRGTMYGGMPTDLKEGFLGTSDEDGGDKDEDANAADDESNTVAKLREVLKAPSESFLAIARLLLARDADVNVVATCDVGETALMYAAMGANVEMVEALLAHGAEVNKGIHVLAFMQELEREYDKAKNLALPAVSKEQTALLEWNEKTKTAREKIKQLLKAAGAKEEEDNDRDDDKAVAETLEEAANDAFSSTITNNDITDLERLIKAYTQHPLGARVLPEALRVALIYNRREMVKLLLAWGVDPNGGRFKPLIQAAHEGDLEYVLLLLEAGADVNATDDNGRTALDYAESWRNSSGEERAVIEALKARGAKSKKQN